MYIFFEKNRKFRLTTDEADDILRFVARQVSLQHKINEIKKLKKVVDKANDL